MIIAHSGAYKVCCPGGESQLLGARPQSAVPHAGDASGFSGDGVCEVAFRAEPDSYLRWRGTKGEPDHTVLLVVSSPIVTLVNQG